jgi:hypothetical protein
MSNASISPSNNTSANEINIIHWRGRSIFRLIAIRISRQAAASFPAWHAVIPNEGMILISITVIGYDNSLSYFSSLFPMNINLHQIYFQQLLRNDMSHAQARTFENVVARIHRQHGQVVILYNFWYFIIKFILI